MNYEKNIKTVVINNLYFTGYLNGNSPDEYSILACGDSKEEAMEKALERLFRSHVDLSQSVIGFIKTLSHTSNSVAFDLKDDLFYPNCTCNGYSTFALCEGEFCFST